MCVNVYRCTGVNVCVCVKLGWNGKALLMNNGTRRVCSLEDGMRLRGDVNVLLLGDPGTAKSQVSVVACAHDVIAHVILLLSLVLLVAVLLLLVMAMLCVCVVV